MAVEVTPATTERFDDVRTNEELIGRGRGEYVRELCGREPRPGVLAYEDGEVVGWAAVAPAPGCPSPGHARSPCR